jgi:uncharacterized transporter YbjL
VNSIEIVIAAILVAWLASITAALVALLVLRLKDDFGP